MGGQEDSPVSDYKSDHGYMSFGVAPADDTLGGLWVEFSRPSEDVSFVASAVHSMVMRSGLCRLEPRVPDTEAGSQIQYQLKAWSEGHYARSAQTPFDTCPYPDGGEMARAWQRGWQFGDNNDDPIGTCEPD